MRTVPIEILRVLLGILAIFFAYALGRTIARLRQARQPYTKATTWVLRTTVCLFGVLWNRGLDITSIVFLVLSGGVFGLACFFQPKPREPEQTHLLD